MNEKKIACVIVGADRIAANGDTANKIGTLALAIAAKRFGVPFYVAAPSSTIDPSIPNGAAIPIEHRGADEVKSFRGFVTAPREARRVQPGLRRHSQRSHRRLHHREGRRPPAVSGRRLAQRRQARVEKRGCQT